MPFVNYRQFLYLVIFLLVLRAGCGIFLYQFLIIAYLFIFQSSCASSPTFAFQPQGEDTIAEEQACFKAGRSTTEHIHNFRILGEKYMQHQHNLYHVFIDFTNFKKAFNRVWHKALGPTMRKYNINASIIRTIENLCEKDQSAVLFNGSKGEWFRTTVGVRQGCLLLRSLFNIFLERIMCEALDDHER